MSVTISIVQDTRRAKNGDKYPLKLRVTFERQTYYYTTENYLDSFEKDVKKEFAQRLVSFKDAGVQETSKI